MPLTARGEPRGLAVPPVESLARGAVKSLPSGLVSALMTYRGRPVIRLEPILDDTIDKNDPFLQLDGIAVGKKENLSNQQMDEIIYGQ